MLLNWARNSINGPRFLPSGRRFGPCFRSRVEASAALSPFWPSVASRFTTSSADIACHTEASPSVFAFVATLMPALHRSLNSKMLFRHVPHLALILVNIPHHGCARRIDLADRQYRYSCSPPSCRGTPDDPLLMSRSTAGPLERFGCPAVSLVQACGRSGLSFGDVCRQIPER